MEQVIFGKWRLTCDAQATRRAHQHLRVGSPEACGCRDCQNFVSARGLVYPPEVVALFGRLGINPLQEAEVYHLGRHPSGLHLYGGWFHFVGEIESEGDTLGPFDFENVGAPFRLVFTNKAALLQVSFKDLPVVQLEFEALVP
jgi:hypothetical protein